MPTSFTHKSSRSATLRRYEAVYNKILNKERQSPEKKPLNSLKPPKQEPKEQRDRPPARASSRAIMNNKTVDNKYLEKKPNVLPKKPLNEYQIFVKNESKNPEYKNLSARLRMIAISKAWRTRNIVNT